MPHEVCHDAELVKRGLSIEQHHITINEMPLDQVPILFHQNGNGNIKNSTQRYVCTAIQPSSP